MNAWIDAHSALLLLCSGQRAGNPAAQGAARDLQGDCLPALLRHWLSFVPVAVMAALVGPDVFFYEGHFNAGTSNLFLMVSLPSLLVAWWGKNYFVTIAFGISLVILARWLGWY